MIDIITLRDKFSYNHETGIFSRKSSPDKNIGWIETTPHTGKTYRRTEIYNKCYYVHRLIWAWVTGEHTTLEIDHIDGNGLNNKLDNLRAASRQENRKNIRRYRTNKSGVTGVCKSSKTGKWLAQIGSSGMPTRYLGEFSNIDDAIAARKAAEINHDYHKNHGMDRPL